MLKLPSLMLQGAAWPAEPAVLQAVPGPLWGCHSAQGWVLQLQPRGAQPTSSVMVSLLMKSVKATVGVQGSFWL